MSDQTRKKHVQWRAFLPHLRRDVPAAHHQDDDPATPSVPDNPHDLHGRDDLLKHEIHEHVASIEYAVPHMLPADSPVTALLIGLARRGLDVYCYASGGEQTGTWCAWITDRRIPLADEQEILAYAQAVLRRTHDNQRTATQAPTTKTRSTRDE